MEATNNTARVFPDASRRGTSLHEAAHAIVGAALGVRFSTVDVYRNSGESEGKRGAVWVDDLTQSPPVHAAAMLTAPMVAYREFPLYDEASYYETSVDGEILRELTSAYGDNAASIRYAGLELAKEQLRLHRNAVKVLAEKLMTDATATEAEVQAILASCN